MAWFGKKKATNGEGHITHVDVVKNEWLAGFQVVVARVCDDGGKLRINAANPEWEALVERYHTAAEDASPSAFVDGLHEHLQGDYLFATEPHELEACPFHGDVILPVVGVEPEREAHRV